MSSLDGNKLEPGRACTSLLLRSVALPGEESVGFCALVDPRTTWKAEGGAVFLKKTWSEFTGITLEISLGYSRHTEEWTK